LVSCIFIANEKVSMSISTAIAAIESTFDALVSSHMLRDWICSGSGVGTSKI
jgi:hypothetical protein